MIQINLIRAESGLYHKLPLYLLSDIANNVRWQTNLSSFGENSNVNSDLSPDGLPYRRVAVRVLRLVTARRPVPHMPYPHVPEYLLAYVVETLECGHQLEFSFIEGAEPLIAKRRVCHECSGAHGALPLLPPKKPAHSVAVPNERKKRA